MDEQEEKIKKSNYDPLSDGMDDIFAPVTKAKDAKKAVRKMLRYLAPHKTAFIVSLVFAVLSTVFLVVGPRIMGRITTTLADGLLAHWLGTGLLTDFNYMFQLTGWLIVLYILSFVFSAAQNIIMANLTKDITYKLRTEISEKMHRLPINYYDTRTRGEILSRITNDVDTMSQTMNQNLTQLVTSGVTLVGVLVMMIWISPLMTLAVILVIPLAMSFMAVAMVKSKSSFVAQQSALGTISGIVEETYGGHNIVRAYNQETNAEETFDKTNKELKAASGRALFITGIMEPIYLFVSNLLYVVVCVLGGFLVVQRTITIGDVQAFIQYAQLFTEPLANIGASSNMIQAMIASAERVFEFLEEEEEVNDNCVQTGTDKARLVPTNISANTETPVGAWRALPANNATPQGKITFQNVRFGYTPDKIILNDFSAEIAAGQTIAIVGPTGAGKTTAVKLLMRFYELNGGNIYIDGINSKDFTRDSLRSIFGMVLQDTWLYNASIMENIRYGSPDATDEEVIAAAKTAHCHEFICALPGGYNMVLNEEASNISQGQKQLFTIARVVLKNPSILILDEATSSIDTRTEILIQKAMKKIMRGRTSFVIAHRLSTIKDADIIFVMKDGDIIEHGSHPQLLAADGFYADLYNSQFSEGAVA